MEYRLLNTMPSSRPHDVYAACPCLSGKRFKWCCKGGVKEVVRAPPRPTTAISNPKCYAAPLADCSDDMSKEHILTHSILKRLTVGKTVNVANPVLRTNEALALPPQAVSARVLCARHNNALSRLDQVGHGFFLRLEQLFRMGCSDNPPAAPALFNGFDLERWFLKTTAAHVAAGWGGERREIPRAWLDIIWGTARFGSDDGLYHLVRGKSSANVGFRHSPISDGGNPAIIGGGFEMFGMHVLVVGCGGKRLDPRFDAVYRPTNFTTEIAGEQFPTDIDFGSGVAEQGLLVEWDGKRESGRVPDAWGL